MTTWLAILYWVALFLFTGASLTLATLEDAVGSTDRPNMPGITEGWPNWKIALHKSLEELKSHPLAKDVIEVLKTARPPAG